MPELWNGAADTLMLNILSVFADFEHDMIASRIRDTRAGFVALGRRIAGVTPFGYMSDKSRKQLTPVEAEAGVVREFFRLIAEGALPREVARLARSKAGRRGPAATGQRGRCWARSPIPSTLAASVRPR
jgi:DNA invertase Pin-like site-specific DNA recombinase